MIDIMIHMTKTDELLNYCSSVNIFLHLGFVNSDVPNIVIPLLLSGEKSEQTIVTPISVRA